MVDGVDHNPVAHVEWVPVEKVVANNYNPNRVAKNEMQLLYTSIKHDGYTQPVVTVHDPEKDVYVIVDGFHRYSIMRRFKDIYDLNQGLLPIVVLKKTINERMASTVRHNRARGKHSMDGMGNLVFEMMENGWQDDEICNELGMEAAEIVKIKHITGFSKLFKDTEFRKAWETKRQIRLRKGYADKNDKH